MTKIADPERVAQIAARFWAKVDRRGPDECWPWTASLAGNGYGSIWWNGHPSRAHRVSWEMHNGPIPKGKGYHGTCVLHHCDNPPCVNPKHLFLGTNADNVHDMRAKGRRVDNPGQSRKTHCKNGHLFSPENTYRRTTNHRDCRACQRIRRRNYHLRQIALLRDERNALATGRDAIIEECARVAKDMADKCCNAPDDNMTACCVWDVYLAIRVLKGAK